MSLGEDRRELTIEIAHETRARRVWTLGPPGDAGPSLAGGTLRFGQADGASVHVGRGRSLRVSLFTGAERRVEQVVHRAMLAAGLEHAPSLRASEGTPFGDAANLLRAARPDAVLAEADDREAEALVDLVECLRAGCAGQEPPPLVLACGPHAARIASAAAPLPAAVIEDLRKPEAVAALVGRMRAIRRDGDDSLVLRDEALEALAAAVARSTGGAALVVDVTGDSTSLVRAEPAGEVHAAHVAGLGIGTAADRVVARAGLDRVRRWIPRAVDAPSLLERVFNRARWPDAIPGDPLALALEIALAHEAVAHALADAASLGTPRELLRSAPTVVLTGRLADFPVAAQSLLIAVNALEPRSFASFVRERDDALVALGALAARGVIPNADAREWLRAHGERLALVVPLQPRKQSVLKLAHSTGRADERVEAGAFRAVRLHGDIEVDGGETETRGRGIAGPLGVLIDARGRPLVLPPRDADRVPTVMRWYETLGALPGAPI